MKTTINSIILCLCAFLVSCQKDSDFNSFSSVLQFRFSDTTHLLADDSSILEVKIYAPGSSDGDFFVASFPKEGGLVLNADASNKIYLSHDSADLKIKVSNTPGLYFLTFQYEDNVQSIQQFNIITKVSLPDILFVEANKSFLDTTSDPVLFTIIPKKIFGKTSAGVGIEGNAFQLSGNDTIEVGRFTGLEKNIIDGDGKIEISFFSDTDNFNRTLPVWIIFTSKNNEGEKISAIYQMKFKE